MAGKVTAAGGTTSFDSVLPVSGLPQAPFGLAVDCTGIDCSGPIDPTIARALTDACVAAKGVLVCRFGRKLTGDEQMNFSRVFGELELCPGLVDGIGRVGVHPLIKNALPPDPSKEQQVEALIKRGFNPYVAHISNVDTKGTHAQDLPDEEGVPAKKKEEALKSNARFANAEWEWHTDMSYIEVPPTFSLLHCYEKPASGGRTSYASMISAYDALSPEAKQSCGIWHLKHDSTYGSGGQMRPGMKPPESPVTAIGHVHPLVRSVPPYADRVLFLGRRTNGYIPELPLEESEKFLNTIWAHTQSRAECYTHEWSVGDLVVWDNRVLLHHREPFDPSERRVMKRTQTKGEPVFPAARL